MLCGHRECQVALKILIGFRLVSSLKNLVEYIVLEFHRCLAAFHMRNVSVGA